MRTHSLMQELRERLRGAAPGSLAPSSPARGAASAQGADGVVTPLLPGQTSRVPEGWPQLPCGPAPADRELLERLKQATVAQVGVGRAGVRLRTSTLLKFLGDRAVAVEAVRSQLPEGFARQVEAAVEVHSRASDLDEFLLRPDLGRALSAEALARITGACPSGVDVQPIVGDGLSAHAVAMNAPGFLGAFLPECRRLGLSVGKTVLVHRSRVKVMDVIGAALGARTALILVGERPGLGTGDGMSAYMVFQPRAEALDSDKEVLSNIHARGTSPEEAGRRVAAMLQEFLRVGASGVKRQANAAPSLQETGRAEPGRARDPVAERHAPRPRPAEAPLMTVAGGRCAG
mgnify:CR=1 FL=1